MKSVEINGKNYDFVFNANTSELYYQVFNEDLFELTMKMKDDSTIILRRNRLQKLAYIGNMQARKPVRELAGRLNLVNYFEWSDQFEKNEFMNQDVANGIMTAWNDSFRTTAKEKNPASQQ